MCMYQTSDFFSFISIILYFWQRHVYMYVSLIYIYGNTQKNEKHQFKKRTFAGGLSPIEVPGFAQGDRRLRERFVLWFHDSCIEWTKYFYSLYIYKPFNKPRNINILVCIYVYMSIVLNGVYCICICISYVTYVVYIY